MNKESIQYIMPEDRLTRKQLSESVCTWLESENYILPAPPVEFEALYRLASKYIEEHKQSTTMAAFIMVTISNYIWLPWLKGVPFNKRLLLLPDCLASSKHCQGQEDQFGLICQNCGNCVIESIEKKAKELGYLVLVAEGSPVVAELIKTGQIQGIVGVSCFEALDKAFKHINNAAVPSIAIPLTKDGCKDTEVDVDWLLNTLATPEDEKFTIQDYDQIQDTVCGWFEKDALYELIEKFKFDISDKTSSVALDWMAREGKRYRPFITAAVFNSLSKQGNNIFPESLIQTALAIEFFHKASLVHDDIEDNDIERYGLPTINSEYGDAYAINVGDFLIGSGYRLLAEQNNTNEVINRLLLEVSKAHQQLSIGQGAELALKGKEVDLENLFSIYKNKTSPAFRVALLSGAIIAGAETQTLEMLSSLSDHLGVAYQIKDDLDDTHPDSDELSILNAYDSNGKCLSYASSEQLLDTFRSKARHSIAGCQIPKLKIFLTRLITKITQ